MGGKVQFAATGTYDDQSTATITDSVTWSVESPSPTGAAAFDATTKGQLNGLKEGGAGVKATSGAVSSSVTQVSITAFNGTVAVAANPTSIVANGTSTSAISATVKTSGGVNVVDGVSVAFAVTGGTGTVAPSSALTVSGVATTTYTSSTTAGSGTVTATVGAKSGNATVTLTAGAAAKINLTANPTTISSSTPTESTLTARILDANDNLVDTYVGNVTFGVVSATCGNIKTGETSVAVASGVATSHVVSTVDATGGAIACTADATGLTQGTVTVTTQPKILQSIAISIVTGSQSPKVGEKSSSRQSGPTRMPPRAKSLPPTSRRRRFGVRRMRRRGPSARRPASSRPWRSGRPM